ncbi:hypothetical protein EG240_05110 [Paenimyroides tangerinum]|uniref:Uncharacterized protein n=1 Tax=Paenimyroides tangerinum TaxID=2488728 RepID=A0A3P3WD76_9FLAO|nr:hypothetical protein [Paenimyroides tangerinum]RRJ91579.1 hypothetical protein EG240_05110 [Paenimyroides tangerinum]
MYTKAFKKFVENGIKNEYHIGTGNPNARILFIGKESAISNDRKDEINLYNKNAKEWIEHINNSTCQILNYSITKEHIFRINKSWGKNTWSKYQKLTNRIFEKSEIPYHIDFLENVFTTEINDSPDKRTSTANKSKLNERKLLFKESEFIQNFPVVVLACSNYIKNNENKSEIEEIFEVKFNEDFPNKKYNKTNWFYSHYNEDKTKLVIHTRQLSADVKRELLNDIGDLIKEHLKKIDSIK